MLGHGLQQPYQMSRPNYAINVQNINYTHIHNVLYNNGFFMSPSKCKAVLLPLNRFTFFYKSCLLTES